MKIGAFDIPNESPTFVIAEIGVNHDGSVDRAISLVHDAAAAGANAVKLQVFQAERLMHRTARFAEYQESRVDAADPIAMLKQYELSETALARIAMECRLKGLAVIATPFSPEDVACIAKFADAIKIASPDLINRPLLTQAIATRLPLIVSTGASTNAEIGHTVDWLKNAGANFMLLHCISSYPTPPADAHLSWIEKLHAFGVPVGYSDHTTELIAGALAVAAGACVIEKHLTYDTTAAGPDHSASFDVNQFQSYVDAIRMADAMLGGGMRRVLECEKDVRDVSRQSLVLRRSIRAGEIIERDHLTTQRPGTGISAIHWEKVIGRVSGQSFNAGDMLTADAIEGWADAA